MSDNDNPLSQPPTKQTSSVPLKKETVRVTLKAADASVPSATVPIAPPVRPPLSPTTPTVGGAPRPPAAAPTITLKKGPPTAPAPAPTTPLKTGAPSAVPTPTVKLATTKAPFGTAPLRPPGLPSAPSLPGTTALKPSPYLPGSPPPPAGTPPVPGAMPTLPKATVQLQPPTQPIGTAAPSLSQAATLKVEEDQEQEGAVGTLLKVLSGLGLAAALALLGFQLWLANVWISVDDNSNPGVWSQILDL